MAAAEMVEVVATGDGFYNGTERRAGTQFKVLAAHASGSSWYRPVAVSIPQTAAPAEAVVEASAPAVAPVEESKPKRAKKRDESETDLG